ncbi:MAG TPA: amino acid permease [Candidatus Limnocylindrales bacterium]|nr:amino acid permease [Candidatus Limnocylindrales bacterium]
MTTEASTATGAPAAAPTLFLRNATGLVKGWSGFDAFGYSFLSVNLVTLGMFYSLAVFAFVPNGSVLSALLLSGVAMTFLCITYAGLIAVMPRAGGDYVWQTRILDGIPGAVVGAVVGGITVYLAAQAFTLGDTASIGGGVLGVLVGGLLGLKRGGIGFVLSTTGWWFILALWAPIYGYILNIEFAQPLAALAGWSDGLTFLSSSTGTFVISLITIVLASGLVALGMAGYARIQRWSIWIGLIALAVIFVLMLVSSQQSFMDAFNREGQNLFGVSNAYQATIDNATANDGFVAGGSPLNFGLGGDTWLLLPFMMFWILYPNWGATLYGEVRGAGDFRKVLNGMLGGLWVTVGLAIVFVLLAAKTFGWDFFNATNENFVDYAYGYVTAAPAVPIWGYPPLLASFLIDSHAVQMLIVFVFGVWFLGWAGTLWLSSTRMIFAAAFDRVLPEWAARVDDRRGVPWAALILIMIPGVILSYLYSFQAGFSKLTLDASLVIAVTFFGTAIAATILPWWKKDLYQKSPIVRYNIGGLPLISVAGAITTIFLGWVLYEWLSNSLYGIGTSNTSSIQFLAALYGIAALVYIVARLYRRSQGIDLDAIHAEIPAE